ncbi:MAG: biotin-dependent carboxyltransferase family protein [Boseongicola sp.]|nr:biotin-dependent carboxyltransferase family protein [Boseongicola sp.]
MTALEIIKCGPGVSVQDAGRFGFRRFGVSTAGAMDRRALALANALAGNPPDTAAVELPLAGAEFRVVGGPVLVAAHGPGTTLAVSGRPESERSSVQLADGDTVMVGPPRDGVYGYFAVAGGILTRPVLGSRSCHRRSGIGGDVLSSGDRLPCTGGSDNAPLYLPEGKWYDSSDAIRIVPGPQADYFEEATWSRLLSSRYRISPRSDRMGLRLEGPVLRSSKGHDIVSEGVVPGSVQLPGDGNPIVLGRDCQTTGGYPKIATVVSADLDRLAQVPTGRDVRFRMVSAGDAIDAARRSAFWRSSLKQVARPVRGSLPELLSHNLIGGMTKGDDL